CLCSRRLPDRAVDSEFGSAPYCVEPPKRGVERGRICKWLGLLWHNGAFLSLAPPALGESIHGGFAVFSVAVRPASILVLADTVERCRGTNHDLPRLCRARHRQGQHQFGGHNDIL